MRPEPLNAPVTLAAPAKVTLTLRVVGRRADGYHLLDAEMVSVDLADQLTFTEEAEDTEEFEGAGGLVVVDEVPGGLAPAAVPDGADNLVSRALRAAGRRAQVQLVKRIPPGAGLGGGSADAACVLRWAGCDDLATAARLGADVPFCLRGGRARVTGIGDQLHPLPFERRPLVLLLPPLAVSTPAVYRRFDELGGPRDPAGTNDLEAAAVSLVPELAAWRDAFAAASGRRPVLAGSGSTWWVDGELGPLADPPGSGRGWLTIGARRAALVAVTTVAGSAAAAAGVEPV